MEKQFREGMRYAGEALDGAPGSCSGINTNSITVIRRDDSSITYRVNFGNAKGEDRVAPIQTIGNWGEYITVGNDRFFAYAIESE
jgi:hypothetical protein